MIGSFLVLQTGAIAKWLKIETKDWKDTAWSHTTHKANQQWFPKNEETPSWSPHTKMNSLYLERMNSLVYILSWCFLRSVSDNCRHFSVYRIKNCKHTRIHRIACEQKHNARYTFSKACCGCWKLWYRRGGFDDFDAFWSPRKRKYEKPI